MSLIAHYRLDGNADDALGQFDATASNVTWVEGKLGQAASFNGSSSYITDSRISEYLHGKAEASISLWVKKNAIQYGFIQLSGFANLNGNLYPHDTETKVYLDVFRTNRLGPIYMPKSVLEMHHVVITQAPGVWRLYQDGELVHETSANETVSTDYLQFEIGRNSTNRYCNGIIDDVRIYDHALSKHEVRDLAKGLVFHLEATESGPKDKSLQGNAVVNNGAAYVENVPVGKGGYEFVSNSIDCGNLFHTTKDQTISIWVKPSNFSARRNFYNRNYGGEGTITQETNGTLNYYWGTNGGNGYPYQGFNSVTGLILNQWNHVCLVRKLGVGGYLRWYINGVQTATATPAYAESAKSVSNLILGTGYTSFFNGVLADVRQYAEALTADDIKDLYQRRASLDAQGNFYAGLIKQSPRARFIRDWCNGSTSNSSNHWVEIQAYDFAGTNVALGAVATSTILTDGVTTSNPYFDQGSGAKSVTVDLGSVVELDYVHVWHYYNDSRTYFGTKTEISEDGVHWTTIFDSAVEGTYKETSEGKIHRVIPPNHVGVTQYGYRSGNVSEIGITDGLVAYYPLTKDAKDYSGNGYDGAVNGAVPVGGGFDGKGAYLFNGSGAFIDSEYPTADIANKSHTVLCWVYCDHDLTTSNFDRLTPFKDAGSWAIGLWFNSSVLRVHTNGRYVDVPWTYTKGWHLLGQVYDAVAGELFAIIDGERLSGSITSFSTSFTGSIRWGVNYLTGSNIHPMHLAGNKVLNRALSPEEIAIEYKRTGPTKMTQHNGTTFIQGQFKEVTI